MNISLRPLLIYIETVLSALLAATLPVQGQPRPRHTFLVTVGINNYSGSANDLSLCVADADTIAWLYRENFAHHTGERLVVARLVNAEATAEAVIRLLRTTFSAARPEDTVVFFYSGHGVPGGLRVYDRGLPYDRVREVIAGCAARRKIVFADACFAGGLRSNRRKRSAGLNEAAIKEQDILLFLGSRSGEPSREMRSLHNGVFTNYLQHGLRGRADRNRDKHVTAHELFEYVSTRVKDQTSNGQHPVMWGRFDDNLRVLSW